MTLPGEWRPYPASLRGRTGPISAICYAPFPLSATHCVCCLLRVCYALSGTDVEYAATRLCLWYGGGRKRKTRSLKGEGASRTTGPSARRNARY
eukprot:1074608-Rhodomonas_salina.2